MIQRNRIDLVKPPVRSVCGLSGVRQRNRSGLGNTATDTPTASVTSPKRLMHHCRRGRHRG